MEDMPALNARLGSVRPPSFSLVVQVRGRGLLFALALTGFAVALLSQFVNAEASAYDRTRPRIGVQGELEVLRQTQLARRQIPYYPYELITEARKTRVQCVYFTEWPPHTYCLVRSGMDFYSFNDSRQYCETILMSVLSMASTPMYRICRLIRHFGIQNRRLWVMDTLHQPDTLGWEDLLLSG
ncbi:hypothetical protein MTO96_019223 [Rhipicephalus appendiculatus]